MNSITLLLVAATLGAQPEMAWKQTDHSLALMRGPGVVWQFNYKPEEGKPYFNPITVAGSSSLTDLRPADQLTIHAFLELDRRFPLQSSADSSQNDPVHRLQGHPSHGLAIVIPLGRENVQRVGHKDATIGAFDPHERFTP